MDTRRLGSALTRKPRSPSKHRACGKDNWLAKPPDQQLWANQWPCNLILIIPATATMVPPPGHKPGTGSSQVTELAEMARRNGLDYNFCCYALRFPNDSDRATEKSTDSRALGASSTKSHRGWSWKGPPFTSTSIN